MKRFFQAYNIKKMLK